MMEFQHIEYFIEACNHKCFSKAAGSLFISQQALSHCIGNLEKELDCILFTRTVKGVEPTAEGKYLYDHFRPVVNSFRDTVRKAADYLEKLPVRLPFCCAPGIIRNISPELLISFNEQHPRIALEMIELSDKQCEEYIHADKSHFGLIINREWMDQQKYNCIKIKTEPSYLLVHKNNPLAACSCVSLKMLKNERVLTLDKTSYQLDDLNHAVEPFNFTIKPFYESTDVMQLCGLVDKGKGILLCIRQISDESGLNNVVLVPIEERTVDYCIAAVFQDYDVLHTAAKQFIQFIIDNIQVGADESR